MVVEEILRPVRVGDSYWTIGGIGMCEWEWVGDEKDLKQIKTPNFFWSQELAKEALLKHFPEFEGRV
jgi:hypothetical protein